MIQEGLVSLRYKANIRLKPLPAPGSQVMNFLWLGLDLPAPPDPADGTIRMPMPENYIGNLRKAGTDHPRADIVLWVDSKRLTEKQMDYLKLSVEDGLPNVHIRDLRSLSAYNGEPLYNRGETDPEWRDPQQRSLIWLQVDAAKVLVSLQGDYDQTFFADLDRAHVNIEASVVQEMIQEHGLMIGSGSQLFTDVENQVWGFNRTRRKFFEEYYADTLKAARTNSNGWIPLVNKVNQELVEEEHIPLNQICLPLGKSKAPAEQPGHPWRDGRGKTSAPATVSGERLAGVFSKRKSQAIVKAGSSADPAVLPFRYAPPEKGRRGP